MRGEVERRWDEKWWDVREWLGQMVQLKEVDIDDDARLDFEAGDL